MGYPLQQICIAKEEYDELLEAKRILSALRWAGVDNWDGYDYAMEILEDLNPDGTYKTGNE